MSAPLTSPHPAAHAVEFYGSDGDLTAAVSRHLADPLRHGAVAVVLATAAHHQRFAEALAGAGLDSSALEAAGRYRALDAHEALEAVAPVTGGGVDAGAFASSVAAAVRRASAEAGGQPVVVFGELVALLWGRGDVESAIAVEALWNALADDLHFDLLCAYPMEAVDGADLGDARRMCRHHTHVRASSDPVVSTSRGSDDAAAVLLPVQQAARSARRFVADVLRDWGHGAVADDAELVASELAANAYAHATSPFVLRVGRGAGRVRIEVVDGDTASPIERTHDAEALGGRGLTIIGALCDRWGTSASGAGKVVWAELPLVTT